MLYPTRLCDLWIAYISVCETGGVILARLVSLTDCVGERIESFFYTFKFIEPASVGIFFSIFREPLDLSVIIFFSL